MNNATAVIQVGGLCPVHGLQTFKRVSDCDWWECPEIGMLEPGSCGSVIPDETLTPDGADVLHWRQSRWVLRDDEVGIKRRVWDIPYRDEFRAVSA